MAIEMGFEVKKVIEYGPSEEEGRESRESRELAMKRGRTKFLLKVSRVFELLDIEY